MELLIVLLIFYSSFTSCAAEKRIIEGQNATVGQFPYYAQISMKFSGYNPGFCGAAIIHERWLLSAAHCFEKPNLNSSLSMSVAVGTNQNYGVKGQEYFVEKVIIHEHYNRTDKNVTYNDIALIRLKSDIRFSTNVQSITLPKNNTIKFDDASVTIPGMGCTSNSLHEEQPMPSILQYVLVKVVPLDQCKQRYIDEDVVVLKDIHLCTSLKNGKSTCKGDSGGPVVLNGLLVGLASFVDSMYPPHRPNVHTRVSSYLDWIKKTTNSDLLL